MASADDHRTYTIRQLCREFGATARALRFYEDKGLLNPARKGQTRVYDARDRARLKLILRGRRIGFTLQEIQQMLDLYDHKDHNAHQMAVALRRHRAQIEQLRRQREDLDEAIATAEEACRVMEQKLGQFRPDLLPGAEEYASLLRERLNPEPYVHAFKARA
ncbi:MAG TPA: MerR family DNA-binding transcriptional regulator [Brevundimonas sp.]|jgi:DNA-binding transcriptional MerR regulator|uniref:MerR family transcriptional regulator n=1 Tax=Brevundimonas sp. TaxID=1871086 RepID=UPI002E0ED592|nr:MerR family DNA-binding transcriptional regulator [Brevundimonas sp.]